MKKIIGIFIVTLLIGTIIPVYGSLVERENSLDKPIILPGNHLKFMVFNGVLRSYRLHIPSSYSGTEPVPLLLVLHGNPAGSLSMMVMTELNDKADEEGFIVVYPNGQANKTKFSIVLDYYGSLLKTLIFGFYFWNCWDFAEVDDVAFIGALFEELQGNLMIDSSRIYVTGFSGGGMMSYRLGAEFSDIIAAIAPCSGVIGGRMSAIEPITNDLPLYIIPEPEYPLPVIHFHGMEDPIVIYDGWKDFWGNTLYMSVNESILFWVEHNGCEPIPEIEISESENIITSTYKNGNQGTEVILYSVVDGGHEWFGGLEAFFPPCEISINDIMWEFFESHPKQ